VYIYILLKYPNGDVAPDSYACYPLFIKNKHRDSVLQFPNEYGKSADESGVRIEKAEEKLIPLLFGCPYHF